MGERARWQYGVHTQLGEDVVDVAGDGVCSLITNAAAIARLVLPRATRTNTSSSRSLNPRGSFIDPLRSSCSTRATSVPAPMESNANRAASSSMAAVSASPTARNATPISSRLWRPRTGRPVPAMLPRPSRSRRWHLAGRPRPRARPGSVSRQGLHAVPTSPAITPSSSAPARARSVSPAASMISTNGPRTCAR